MPELGAHSWEGMMEFEKRSSLWCGRAPSLRVGCDANDPAMKKSSLHLPAPVIRAGKKIIARAARSDAYRRGDENPFDRARALRGAGAHRGVGAGARAHARTHGAPRRRGTAV